MESSLEHKNKSSPNFLYHAHTDVSSMSITLSVWSSVVKFLMEDISWLTVEHKQPNFSKILLFLSQDVLLPIDLLFIWMHTHCITLYVHLDRPKSLPLGTKMKAIIFICLSLQELIMATLVVQLVKVVKLQRLSSKRMISARWLVKKL